MTLSPTHSDSYRPLVGPTLAVVAKSRHALTSRMRSAVQLTTEEIDRQRRLTPAAQEDYLAARVVARLVVAAVTGQDPATIALVQECSQCGGLDHGKPSISALPSVRVSWSHTNGVVAAVAGAGPVGIDVERRTVAGHPGDSFLRRVFGADGAREVDESTEPEHHFLSRWTQRECLVKLGVAPLVGAFDERRLAHERRLVVQSFTHQDPDAVGSCVSSEPVRFASLGEIGPPR